MIARAAAPPGNSGLDRGHGQVAADDAGRADQDLVGVEVEPVGRQLGHQQRVPEALRPGAGVGVAGVDGQRLDPVPLQVQLVDHDRRRFHLVGGEHAAGVARVRGVDYAQVFPLVGRDG